MTSSSRSYTTRIPVKHNKTKGWVVLDQIRTMDIIRIVKLSGNLTEKEVHTIKSVIHET